MPMDPAIAGVVYLGNDWLLYADPDLIFNLAENVAPALVLGPAHRPATLTLRDGHEVCAPVMLHASGVWSRLVQRSALAFLYVDPLSGAGSQLQRRARGGVVAWPDADLLTSHGIELARLCKGEVPAAQVQGWVGSLLAEVAGVTDGRAPIDTRLAGIRTCLHQRGEGRVDPAAIAHALGLSAEHVRKHFRHEVGMTLSSYQAWVRLYQVAAHACEAQKRGNGPNAAELVSAGGFYDASHASRAIRRYFDLLPTEMLSPQAFVDCRFNGVAT